MQLSELLMRVGGTVSMCHCKRCNFLLLSMSFAIGKEIIFSSTPGQATAVYHFSSVCLGKTCLHWLIEWFSLWAQILSLGMTWLGFSFRPDHRWGCRAPAFRVASVPPLLISMVLPESQNVQSSNDGWLEVSLFHGLDLRVLQKSCYCPPRSYLAVSFL